MCAYGAATLIHRHLKVRENRRRVFLSVSLSFKLEPDVASTSCYRDGLSLSLLSFLFRHVFAGERVSRWSDGEIGECFTTKKGTKLSSRKTGGPLGIRWMISEHQLRGNKREQLKSSYKIQSELR